MLLFILPMLYVLIDIQTYHLCRGVIIFVLFLLMSCSYFSCRNFFFDAGAIIPSKNIIEEINFKIILIFCSNII